MTYEKPVLGPIFIFIHSILIILMLLITLSFKLLIHSANPQSRPVVIFVFTHVHPSVRLHISKQNNFQAKTMFRYWRDCGSDRVDHWWHLSFEYYFTYEQDFKDPLELLHPSNVQQSALLDYIRDTCDYCTDYQLPNLQFALNHHGQPDVALFDFTSMFAARNSIHVKERHGKQLLSCLVGDGLLEV